MNKRTIINSIYTALNTNKVTSRIYRDSDWTGVTYAESIIDKAIKDCGNYCFAFGTTHYEGRLGETDHCKIYEFAIIDVESDEEIISGNMICTFCGTIGDPMGAYDITITMSVA